MENPKLYHLSRLIQEDNRFNELNEDERDVLYFLAIKLLRGQPVQELVKQSTEPFYKRWWRKAKQYLTLG